jgi:putative membrane protein
MATAAISRVDHERVAAAIRKAETATDGEIYCVVAHRSDSYFFPSAFMALAGILIAGVVLAYAAEFWWLSIRLPHFMLAACLAAVCALALLWLAPGLRVHLVPWQMRHRMAHDNAVRQFLARNIHLTAARTGVLIFVSLAEHYAEVIADSGIDSRVEQQVWDDVVRGLTEAARAGRLADGFVAAVSTVGAVLAEHFPVSPGDVNELDDQLIEI